MRLHLYQDLQYLCTSRDISATDHLKNVETLSGQCSRAGITHTDEDIITVLSDKQKLQPLFFGAGPAEPDISLPDPFSYLSLPKGDYLFYQFSDTSQEGIRDAVNDAESALFQKGWSRQGAHIYIRGVKEGPGYALQVIIPLE